MTHFLFFSLFGVHRLSRSQTSEMKSSFSSVPNPVIGLDKVELKAPLAPPMGLATYQLEKDIPQI